MRRSLGSLGSAAQDTPVPESVVVNTDVILYKECVVLLWTDP